MKRIKLKYLEESFGKTIKNIVLSKDKCSILIDFDDNTITGFTNHGEFKELKLRIDDKLDDLDLNKISKEDKEIKIIKSLKEVINKTIYKIVVSQYGMKLIICFTDNTVICFSSSNNLKESRILQDTGPINYNELYELGILTKEEIEKEVEKIKEKERIEREKRERRKIEILSKLN
ncbi:MAG TPA: hypothetical protein PLD95_04080 [bacterium]|jgi:hypothetical protein|nr:hypothetical protein [bacterium]